MNTLHLKTKPQALSRIHISSPLGLLTAVGDEESLYFLAFTDSKYHAQHMAKLSHNNTTPFHTHATPLLEHFTREMESYFAGELQKFTTPLALIGTVFQKNIWDALAHIPYGQTQSYKELATSIQHPTAFRAAAQANAANPLMIIIPCHRIINNTGSLGGYSGSLTRKAWLINHEKNYA